VQLLLEGVLRGVIPVFYSQLYVIQVLIFMKWVFNHKVVAERFAFLHGIHSSAHVIHAFLVLSILVFILVTSFVPSHKVCATNTPLPQVGLMLLNVG
jgi:hypothetical protein